MNLSPNFTLDEAVFSQSAIRRGLNNQPAPHILDNMKIAAQGMEKVRSLLNCPIIVSSWYRSPRLNTIIGGSKTSDHPNGWCIDFINHKYNVSETFDIIKSSNIDYDQLINEFGRWVHISFSPKMRRQSFKIG